MTDFDNVIRAADVVRGDTEAKAPPSAPAVVIDLAAHRKRLRTGPAAERPLTLSEVWSAINAGRIVLHYQAQFDLNTGKVACAEALLRLKDTNGRLIFPDRFIDWAEDSDLIVPLGRAVIERACRDLADIRASGGVLPRIAINVSAYQLSCDDGLVDFVDETLVANGLNYADLEFELTERQRLDSSGQGVRTIKTLAERGLRLAIDDFGVGYSSVVCLTELPISSFKLDKALIGQLPENIAMQGVVKSLLAIGEHLGLEVVAEGVETEAQHDWLVRAGCPAAQGFGYAKPMDIDSLREKLLKNGPRVAAI